MLACIVSLCEGKFSESHALQVSVDLWRSGCVSEPVAVSWVVSKVVTMSHDLGGGFKVHRESLIRGLLGQAEY